RIGRWVGTQPLLQLRPTPLARDVAYRDGNGLLLPDQHDQPLAAGDAGVEKIPLQHSVVLRHDRNHYGWVFRALALVDARGVCRHEHVEFTESISDGPAVEAYNNLARVRINIDDVADVAVVDLLV